MTTFTGRPIRTAALTGTAALAMVFGSACTDTVEDGGEDGGGIVENGGGDNDNGGGGDDGGD
ncbi:MAG TPA: hypothetical protein VE709_07975 [Pseudonocardiaceae bacterium]|jgi:hypothetical protein|nr:hypothetical protein [Pseudonocardiaceae bacterium]